MSSNYRKQKIIDFLVVNGDVMVMFLLVWLFFTLFVCLQVMCTTSFYFLQHMCVLLCFCWMHFQWCGFVYACALINVDQGVRDEDKNKSYLYGRDILFHQVSTICQEISYIMIFSCVSLQEECVFTYNYFMFKGDEVFVRPCASIYRIQLQQQV